MCQFRFVAKVKTNSKPEPYRNALDLSCMYRPADSCSLSDRSIETSASVIRTVP